MERLERGATELMTRIGLPEFRGESALAVLLLAALVVFAAAVGAVILVVRARRGVPAAPRRPSRVKSIVLKKGGVVKTLKKAGFSKVQFLAEGGIGEIYRARHPTEPIQCAVKVLRTMYLEDSEITKKFLYEGQILTRIGEIARRHYGDNGSPVVHCFTYGYIGELPYLQLEYVEGVDLAQVMKMNPNGLAHRRALMIACRVAEGLAMAHSLGVYHRDVTPDNILFYSKPGAPKILVSDLRLIDFGVAKIEQRKTMTGEIYGKPLYMSPEQCANRHLDGRTDIYSLGVVLYEMLCGRVPFDDPRNFLYVMRMHEEEPVPPLPSRVPEAIREFVVEGMLAKDPDTRRPRKMKECVSELRRLMG